jgi:hypothetical protein
LRRAGKHPGLSLPAALFRDIGWFFSSIEEGKFERFEGSLAVEAELVADRAMRIAPRGSYEGADYVWFFNDQDVFTRVAGLRAQDVAFNRKSMMITNCIDLSLPRDLNPDQGRAYKELANQVTRLIFGREWASPSDIEAFFADGANFMPRRCIGEIADPGRRRLGHRRPDPPREAPVAVATHRR